MKFLDWWEQFKKITIQATQPNKRPKIYRYIFPIILLAFAYLIKSFLLLNLNIGTPYLTSTFIVILSSWYGGLGPGIFATILAALLNNYLFLEPQFSFVGLGNAITTLVFLLQGFFISMISEAKRNADIQKDEFISFASHELKNPLAIIKGYNSILQQMAEKKKDTKFTNYLLKTGTYIDKATNLINELLDITKIESGKLSLNKENIEIYPLVKDIISDQQVISNTHQIVFTGKTNKKIYGDKIRIGQVITNMITNAIKYSPGKKKIEVYVTNKKGSVIISVKDYGIGLSDQEQNKVFERFYRASNTQIQGLGLGLYISLGIAQLHNGELWVESKKGKGSTFFFSLPFL